jgi:hypothetical protein
MCSANLLAKFLCILIILTCLNFLSSSDRIRTFLWQVLATLNNFGRFLEWCRKHGQVCEVATPKSQEEV